MLNKNKKNRRLLVLSVLLAYLMTFGALALAAEETPKGGQVTTKSTITFYQKGDSKRPPNKPAQDPPANKPSNKLPQTGEVLRPLNLIVGLSMVAFVLLFIWKRRKKEEAYDA